MTVYTLLYFTFGLLLPSAQAATQAGCQCGKWTNPERDSSIRIVGGSEAVENSMPWLVGLIYPGSNPSTRPRCGGSLVSRKHVLTAAHCNFGIKWVMVGAHNWRSPQTLTIIKVVKVTSHPGYSKPTTSNDIAIVEMEKEVVLSSKVGIVCLPPPNLRVNKNQPLTIAGWGVHYYKGPKPDKLRFARVQKVNCLGGTSKYMKKEILSMMFCASRLDVDSCQGDSGGPLTALMPIHGSQRVVQVGIVSWGRGCASRQFPGVYTNVSLFSKFIRDNTRGTCVVG